MDDNIIIRFYDMLDHILFDVNPCDTDEKTRPKKRPEDAENSFNYQ